MSRGILGTYAIDWSQCDVDGMSGLTPNDLGKGARWLWRGKPVRLDGPQELLSLGQSLGSQQISERAARSVRKLMHSIADICERREVIGIDEKFEPAFHITDGTHSYFMHIIETQQSHLVVFEGDIPDAETEYWVVSVPFGSKESAPTSKPNDIFAGICATSIVDTPLGPRPLAELAVGELITTLDFGPIPILWIGEKRISGARIHVMPQMRPVRVKAGALGHKSPGEDTWVSPQQRLVVKGKVAKDLYNTDEVLVAAKDLVDGRSIYRDHRVREVNYRTVMFAEHAVLRINKTLVESFHPARANLSNFTADDQNALHVALAKVGTSVLGYGHDTRRGLSASEAAVLRYSESS